jgi:hypothetical protein
MLPVRYGHLHVKSKVIPVTGRGDPSGSGTLRMPHFLGGRLADGSDVISVTRRPLSTPRNIPDTHFCCDFSRRDAFRRRAAIFPRPFPQTFLRQRRLLICAISCMPFIMLWAVLQWFPIVPVECAVKSIQWA